MIEHNEQMRTPLFDALKTYRDNRIVRFDVPGHKAGRGTPELTEFLGQACLAADVNSSKPLDNLIHPSSVIKEAQELAAKAFKATAAFFMVGGTSSSIQAMIVSHVKEGEKLIMPRNVHRSAINALIISGGIPVYVDPGVDNTLGIPLAMSLSSVREAIRRHPDAKAILVNNPTYYGICSDLKAICEVAHLAGMKVLADEAHGTHFYFGDNLPASAMACGCDMSAVSMHKTGGSLTQSSILLAGPGVNLGHIHQNINIFQTTSASYLLMSSLDISRKNLALNGQKIFAKTLELACYARQEINEISSYIAFDKSSSQSEAFYDFDGTKLSVYTRDVGLAGVEVYDILRDEFDIQIEFGDLSNILAIISAGDRAFEIERLISALAEIKRLYGATTRGMLAQEYVEPELRMSPKQAFYADSYSLLLEESLAKVSAEFVMCYPPGIPIVAPGEVITADVLDYIKYAKEKGSLMTGTEDMKVNYIKVLSNS